MRVFTPGLVIGVGMGGFIDGIALHQIAQWHNMGSAILPPHTMEAMSRNMVWDGQFHLATWVITLMGVWMLWSDRARSAPVGRMLLGQMVLGWGVFNLVEGVINHHVLQLHHVIDMPMHVPLYDWLFLAFGGLLLILIGAMLARPGADTG